MEIARKFDKMCFSSREQKHGQMFPLLEKMWHYIQFENAEQIFEAIAVYCLTQRNEIKIRKTYFVSLLLFLKSKPVSRPVVVGKRVLFSLLACTSCLYARLWST